MRKTLILLVVSLLLLWTGRVLAYHRPIAKPSYGDPDEFQAHRYHDEGGGVTILGCSRTKRQYVAGAVDPEEREKKHKRRYLSIHFAGRTFFLER